MWVASLHVGCFSPCGLLLSMWVASLHVGCFSPCGLLLSMWVASLHVGCFSPCGLLLSKAADRTHDMPDTGGHKMRTSLATLFGTTLLSIALTAGLAGAQ